MKKGGAALVTEETFLWMGSRIIITIIVILAAISIVYLAINRDFDVNDALADMKMRRAYYSTGCFAFEDINVDPGVIDLKKFDEFRLNQCLGKENAIRAKLEKRDKTISTKSFNDELTLCKISKDKCYFSNKQYVLVNDNGKIDFDSLKLEVVVR
tara:strand:+ start:388 stop:852 length:465 start_codon:yes stop_codon:yes gene_type:complete